MDVDPGKPSSVFYFNSFSFVSASDVQVQSAPVRLLAYSSVPGITLNSRLYIKAVSVIAKQQQVPTVATTVNQEPAALTESASTSSTWTNPNGMKKDSPGTFQALPFAFFH
jgi:hypothetical protein